LISTKDIFPAGDLDKYGKKVVKRECRRDKNGGYGREL
jgi:hypothetical protein